MPVTELRCRAYILGSMQNRLTEANKVPSLSRFHSILAAVLLTLACLHCTRSIFFNNMSWLDLHAYADGQERRPFQERIAMMPILKAAEKSHFMQIAAQAIDREDRHQLGRTAVICFESMSAEKLACMIVGAICNLIAVAMLWIYGRQFGVLRWLPPAIFLAILYASFAARYEEANWFPYDLPHTLLFGAACLCLFSGRYWAVLVLFAFDVPVRETSIYLVLLAAPFFWQRWRGARASIVLVVMVLGWLACRIEVGRAFAHNASETSTRLIPNLKNLALPLHWPQMASVIGFLLIPVWLGRVYLPRMQRQFLWLMLPCLAVTLAFGIWIESRIALEWSMPIALMAAGEIVGLMRIPSGNQPIPIVS
jgi:hypothetical protein